MKLINEVAERKNRPTVALQFGEGNFLRGFVGWMVDIANEKGVMDVGIVIVKPIKYGSLDAFDRQGCLYTVLLRGKLGGELSVSSRIVTSAAQAVGCYENYPAYRKLAELECLELIVSNTTEAGIAYDESDEFHLEPPSSYPGKLTKFLYERYQFFGGDEKKGLIIIPLELIEANGDKLHECVRKLSCRWKLEKGFLGWIEKSCVFCNTLVDRIITGYPGIEKEAIWEQLGYKDELIVTGEPFALWVIEASQLQRVKAALPLDKAGLPVIFTHSIKPFRDRKVRVLNGAHTGVVLAAFLAGFDTVGECMKDKDIKKFMEKMIYEEILPTVDLPREDVESFAASVIERFENPFIRHEILSIALNSISKWKTRILPSLIDFVKLNSKIPRLLSLSFAALIQFYRASERGDQCLVGKRDEGDYIIKDDAIILDFFAENAEKPTMAYIKACMANEGLWGMNLREVEGFEEAVGKWLLTMEELGMLGAIKEAALQTI
ncbi:MAG: tagaturonate reductase [Clostridiales bacterium]|nr:tagaturonate reductase [Clostridiales bacterium]